MDDFQRQVRLVSCRQNRQMISGEQHGLGGRQQGDAAALDGDQQATRGEAGLGDGLVRQGRAEFASGN